MRPAKSKFSVKSSSVMECCTLAPLSLLSPSNLLRSSSDSVPFVSVWGCLSSVPFGFLMPESRDAEESLDTSDDEDTLGVLADRCDVR